MSKNDTLCQHEGPKIDPQLMEGWNERQQDMETNAMRQARRDEMLLIRPNLDANSITDDDFNNLVEEPVLDCQQRVIGYKSVIKRKRRK